MDISKLKTSKSLLVFVGLTLLIIFGLAALDLIRVPWVETTRRKFLLYNGTKVDLFGDKKLEQTFIANYPGLTKIDVLIKKNSVPGQPITLHLKDACDAQDDIVEVTTTLPVIEDFVFYPFEFPPLDNSAGQSYCLLLEAPEATPEAAVQLQLSTGDLYPYGVLKIHNLQTESEPENAIPTDDVGSSFVYKIYLPIVINADDASRPVADMGFRLHYRGLLWPTVQVFVSRLTANKPLVWGQPWFYGGLVLVYGILLVGLFYVARRTVRANGGK